MLKHRLILSVLSALLFQGAALAQETSQKTSQEPSQNPATIEADRPRISLEAGMALDIIVLHLFKGRVAYRLPVLEDRLDVFLEYSPDVNTPNVYYNSHFLAGGARYYFQTSGWLQPYAVATVGGAFHLAVPAENLPKPEVNSTGIPAGLDAIYLQAGAGLDLMFTPNFGLNGQLTVGNAALLRPEINLKLTF